MGETATARLPPTAAGWRQVGVLVLAAGLQAACLLPSQSPVIAAELARTIGAALTMAAAMPPDAGNQSRRRAVAHVCALAALALAAGTGSYAFGRLTDLHSSSGDPQLIARAGVVAVAARLALGERRQAAASSLVLAAAVATALGWTGVDPALALVLAGFGLHAAWRSWV